MQSAELGAEGQRGRGAEAAEAAEAGGAGQGGKTTDIQYSEFSIHHAAFLETLDIRCSLRLNGKNHTIRIDGHEPGTGAKGW